MDQRLLYVGCGHHRMAGFIHVEISTGKYKSGPTDILADITRSIPVESDSVDLIFSRATLEHLTYRELINHFLECNRILKKGGVVRMVVPDFDVDIKEYFHKIHYLDLEENPDFPNENHVDMFIATMGYPDHFYLHNFNTLSRALRKTGFTDIRECDSGDTKVEIARDEIFMAEIARHGEIIMEAVKSGEKPSIERFDMLPSRNPIKRILAKYFNITITPYIKRRPMFPHAAWFREKWMFNKKVDFENIKHETTIRGRILEKPKYEDKLDLTFPVSK